MMLASTLHSPSLHPFPTTHISYSTNSEKHHHLEGASHRSTDDDVVNGDIITIPCPWKNINLPDYIKGE